MNNFNSLVETWMRAYSVTLPTEKQKERRLKELQTWDESNGNAIEHRAKKHALIRLLN